MVLKVKFLSTTSVEITFVYIDDRLLSKGGNPIHFYNKDYNFMIYSSDTLMFTDTSLRLPCLENYKPNVSKVFSFYTPRKMKAWLLNLYIILKDCNKNFTPFVNDVNYGKQSCEVTLNGNYWIV